MVVAAAEGWHPGVVGLVAARLKEKFGRPAFAIALDHGGDQSGDQNDDQSGGIGTGSGRSIPGVDLGRAVRSAVADGILIKGGGHAMAAGVTLRKDALGEFRAFLDDFLRDAVEAARRVSAVAGSLPPENLLPETLPPPETRSERRKCSPSR
jgi:single-stranded-DNA-specific exonuclease